MVRDDSSKHTNGMRLEKVWKTLAYFIGKELDNKTIF